MDYRAQQIVLAEMIGAVRDAEEWQKRLEQYLSEAVKEWSLGPVADAPQAMRHPLRRGRRVHGRGRRPRTICDP